MTESKASDERESEHIGGFIHAIDAFPVPHERPIGGYDVELEAADMDFLRHEETGVSILNGVICLRGKG
ncbi:MAG TPA: hypothetical protein VEN78_16945 [Bradyrhizobium sp.]|nr:hypothetical protein [Bradyrhizobium sp.]